MDGLTGRTIGNYQVLEELSRGDGTVRYKGFQPSTSRYVMIETLAADLADDGRAQEAFRHLAERNAQLEHPNILPVYDYGQQDGRVYLVSRFIEKGTLADQPPRARSGQSALDLLRPIVNALEYAQKRGLNHGQLSASTLFLDPEGTPYLADFGLDEVTTVLGTPSSALSPEAQRGELVDRRTDVYGLGGLLYQLVIGEPPTTGAGTSPRQRQPSLAPEVEKVILKAMAIEPDFRYQNPRQFLQALEVAVTPARASRAVPAGAASPAQRAAPPVSPADSGSDRSWIVFLLGGVFVVLLGFFLINFLGGDDEVVDPSEPVATEEPGGILPPPTEATEQPLEPTEAPPPPEEPTETPPEEPTEMPPPDEPTAEVPGGGDGGEDGDGGAGGIGEGGLAGVCSSPAGALLLLGGVLHMRHRTARRRRGG